ncbi:unnamed protein product [Urochloa humidicola]
MCSSIKEVSNAQSDPSAQPMIANSEGNLHLHSAMICPYRDQVDCTCVHGEDIFLLPKLKVVAIFSMSTRRILDARSKKPQMACDSR